ncbi:MAG: Tetratricopeptide 1 repeat-containing protein [Geminicoccaceae bacterium]|nr:Tetratricopeptide 1 repeat-containing protein [Geminicoccaceae bacterium]
MNRLIVPGLMIGLVLGACSAATREARRGGQQYAQGRYLESYQAFQRALSARPNPAFHFAMGASLYRLKRYEEAARSFRQTTGVPRFQRQSYYNLGNAYVRAAEESADKERLLSDAIAAYEQVLRLEPNDSAAKWNLELALRRQDEDRESGGSSGRGRSADYGRGNMNVPGYDGNPEAAVGAMAGGGFGAGEGESAEELSETQARQLLEAVEREQLSSHQGNPAMRGGSDQLDW